MAINKEQIIQNVKKLEDAGVPEAEIKKYFQSATSEIQAKPEESRLEKAAGISEKYLLSPLSKFFGIQQAVEFIGEQGKRIGTALAQFDPIVREEIAKSPETFERITGQSISAREEVQQVGAEALKTGATLAPFTTGMFVGSPAQIGMRGGAIAGTRQLGESLEEDDDFKDTLKSVSYQAILGAGTSYLFAKAFQKLPQYLVKRAEKQMGRAVKPTSKRLRSDIRSGYESIASRITKEGYRGTDEKIFSTAVRNKESFGKAIGGILDDTDKVITSKSVVSHFDELFNDDLQMALLKNSEKKALADLIKKLPKNMTASEANKFKVYFNKQVPSSAWTEGASSADSFRAKLYKSIAGGFRREIEVVAPEIAKINEKWAIANDVIGMVDEKLAAKIRAGGIFEKAKHGPLATLVELAGTPFTATRTRTGLAQMQLHLANMSKNELIERISNMLILRSQ